MNRPQDLAISQKRASIVSVCVVIGAIRLNENRRTDI
jgi:hypothetical protein